MKNLNLSAVSENLTKDIGSRRRELIDIAKRLGENGLLVRTWGNISVRDGKDHMLISPSGIRYEDMEADNICRVNIRDLSWDGKLKPSSEMLVHAAAYIARPDCEYIVHTHQTYATVASCLGIKDLKIYSDDYDLRIPVADYALPGTARLADNVASCLNRHRGSDFILLSNHGTLCLGESADECVEQSVYMEKACRHYLTDKCRTDLDCGIVKGYDSHMEDGRIVYEDGDVPQRVKRIHEEIYKKRPDVSYIVHNKSEASLIVSRRATVLRPLLDDFAQIIGTGVRIPFNYHGRDGGRLIVSSKVNCVFVPDDGVYCLGDDLEEARAAALIADKACIAQVAASRSGHGKALGLIDCMKMNRNYRKKYAALAKK
ncbi:class II aldolase/adducin family protein [Butyrivibrio sp. MC2013]|uniref:class II aldolase/adducin family protein n=1 Tax=Butyrivibrio sp. MC2013 TaxID=1280686 RepID=UPI0003F693D5|nr:class II aldolase/adducin family protein [Butyrivibrio sp. MC2013]